MLDPTLIESPEVSWSVLSLAMGILTIAMVGMFIVTGYSMKFSLAITGVGRFGFWKSIAIVFAGSIASTVVSTMLVMSAPGELLMSFLALIGSVLAYCGVISVVGGCGLGKSFTTYLLSSVFNFLGALPVCLLACIAYYSMQGLVDPDGMIPKRWGKQFAEAHEPGAGSAIGHGAGEFDFTKILHRGTGQDSNGMKLPEQLPPVLTGDEDSGGFFGFGKEERASPYPKPSSGCRSSCSAAKPKPKPPAAPPVSHGPQTNPFVK